MYFAVFEVRAILEDGVTGCGIVIEPNEEEDRPWDVDEGVDPVDPCEGGGMCEETALNRKFPEDVERLFESDELEGMVASYVDGRGDEGYCGEGAAELVDLLSACQYDIPRKSLRCVNAHPINQSPVEGLLQEWKFFHHSAKPPVSELFRIGCPYCGLEAQNSKFPFSPA